MWSQTPRNRPNKCQITQSKTTLAAWDQIRYPDASQTENGRDQLHSDEKVHCR